jgi:hypothetical protein
MYKLIDSSSFFDAEDLQVTILSGPGIQEELTKAAADDRVKSYVMDNLKIQPGKMYLHINAMGAGEFYGPNRNGDYFPEETLKLYYKTFETSPAHVFRHHINKDPARAIGRVIFALYNERMHRVELVAEVDRGLGSDVESRIAAGDFPATSMACKTPYDVCSICHNKAHTRQEYCVHLKQHLGRVMPDGRRVMSINSAPLRFFDISIVVKPADITSSVLQKVANEDGAVSSALLGEEEGLSYGEDRVKKASLAKVSELIKEIEGYVQGTDKNMENILAQIQDPDIEDVRKLESVPMDELFQTFGELGISPSLKFLAEIIAFRMGHGGPGIGSKVLKALHESKLSGISIPDTEMNVDRKVSPLVSQVLSKYQDTSSLFPEFVEKRAYVTTTGYSGMGPKIPIREEDIRRDLDRQRHLANPERTLLQAAAENPISTLIAIGGAALWAKAYINSIIEKRLAQSQERSMPTIVKMASMSAAHEMSFEDRKATVPLKALSKAVSALQSPSKGNAKLTVALKVLSAAHSQIVKGNPS